MQSLPCRISQEPPPATLGPKIRKNVVFFLLRKILIVWEPPPLPPVQNALVRIEKKDIRGLGSTADLVLVF